ncbi:hypothetical protein BH10ACT11_BH10ACT11_17060 [soil metagenome]
MSVASVPAVVGALAGGLGALAVREALVATPAIAGWIGATVDPARRARQEGYIPSAAEVRRLAGSGAGALLAIGWWLLGLIPALSLALAGPAAISWAIGARRERYGREVESGVPAAAIAIADSMAGGRSVRAALTACAPALEGPVGVEMARVAADLELGASVERALAGMRTRVRSPRVDSLAAVLVSQRLAGGDLIGLLRRSAEAGAERERMLADARSATAQARFTGILVVAMPAGAGLFAELLSPGFVSGLLANGVATALLLAAGGLQVVAFLAIRKLSRIGRT